MRTRLALALALCAGCSSTVSSTDAAPGADAVVPPEACAWFTGRTPAITARMIRAGSGPVVAWIPVGGRELRVARLDERLREVHPSLQLPALQGPVRDLAIERSGDELAVAFGSSLVILDLSDGAPLAVLRRHELAGRTLRGLLARSAGGFLAASAEGYAIFIAGERARENTPNAPLAPPHGPELTITQDRSQGGYIALEPAPSPSQGLLTRSFIFGHGASILGDTTRDGLRGVSRVARGGESLYRLVLSSTTLALETRDAETLAVTGEALPLSTAVATPDASGAVSSEGAEVLAAWSEGASREVRARWIGEPSARVVEGASDGPSLRVFDASGAAQTRGWVLLGARLGDDSYAIRARCVERAL